MLNIRTVLIVFLLFALNRCKSNAQTDQKTYRFQSKESNIYNTTVNIKKDSSVTFGGGMGEYRHWGYGQLKKLSDNKFIILQNEKQKGGIKVEVKDEKMRKVLMLDNNNDTLYFLKDNKSFVYKDRIFQLEENAAGKN